MSEVSHQQASETKAEQKGQDTGDTIEQIASPLSGFAGNTNPAKLDRQSLKPGDILALQRTIGNQAVQRLLKQASPGASKTIQRAGLTAEERAALNKGNSGARNFWKSLEGGKGKTAAPTPGNRETPQGSQGFSGARNFWQNQTANAANAPAPANREPPQAGQGISQTRQFWSNLAPGPALKQVTAPPAPASVPEEIVENTDLEYWENRDITEPVPGPVEDESPAETEAASPENTPQAATAAPEAVPAEVPQIPLDKPRKDIPQIPYDTVPAAMPQAAPANSAGPTKYLTAAQDQEIQELKLQLAEITSIMDKSQAASAAVKPYLEKVKGLVEQATKTKASLEEWVDSYGFMDDSTSEPGNGPDSAVGRVIQREYVTEPEEINNTNPPANQYVAQLTGNEGNDTNTSQYEAELDSDSDNEVEESSDDESIEEETNNVEYQIEGAPPRESAEFYPFLAQKNAEEAQAVAEEVRLINAEARQSKFNDKGDYNRFINAIGRKNTALQDYLSALNSNLRNAENRSAGVVNQFTKTSAQIRQTEIARDVVLLKDFTANKPKGFVAKEEMEVGKKAPVRYATTRLNEHDLGEDRGVGVGAEQRKTQFLAGVTEQTRYLNKVERKPFRFTIKDGTFYGPGEEKPLLDSSKVAKAASIGSHGGYIFVMTRRGKFYFADAIAEYNKGIDSHKKNKESNRVVGFHHSSFKAGGAVAGAGEIHVVNGKLVHVTDASGHFQPSAEFVMQVLKEFERMGVDLSKVQLFTHEDKSGSVSADLYVQQKESSYKKFRKQTNWFAEGERKSNLAKAQAASAGA